MVHKALKIPESRFQPLLVRPLFGLLFWLYSLSLAFVLPGDGKLKLKAWLRPDGASKDNWAQMEDLFFSLACTLENSFILKPMS